MPASHPNRLNPCRHAMIRNKALDHLQRALTPTEPGSHSTFGLKSATHAISGLGQSREDSQGDPPSDTVTLRRE